MTQEVREFGRTGLRHRYPNATEEEIFRMDADRLLVIHGTSLADLRRKQREEMKR